MYVRFPQHVEGAWLEAQHDQFSREPPSRVSLDIGGWDTARLFADGRLLGLLASLRAHGTEVAVRTGQAELEAYRPEALSRLWALFTGTPAGIIAVQMADAVIDRSGEDRRPAIRAQQAVLASDPERLGWGTGQEKALIAVSRAGGPPPDRPLGRAASYQTFAGRVRAITGSLFNGSMGSAHMVALQQFAAEAVSNTARHAVTGYAGKRIDGLRFVLFRRLPLVQEGTSAALGSESEALASYLDELREWIGPRARRTPLAEVTVADSGVGIAGRFGGADMYAGTIDHELGCVMEAMRPGTTSTGSSRPGAGMGLDKMLTSCRELGGLIVLRSGRLELRFDGLAARRGVERAWRSEPRPLITGTSVSALFPWQDRVQLQLPVESP
jgi:hypothetical protein